MVIEGTEISQAGGSAWKQARPSIAFSACAFGLLLIHLFWKTFDSAALLLCALAAVPWLATFLTKLKMPGGMEIEFKRLVERVAAVSGEVRSASRQVEAVSTVAMTRRSKGAPQQTLVSNERLEANDADQEMDGLIRRYTELRDKLNPSSGRTTEFNNIVGKMIAIVPQLKSFDVTNAIKAAGKENRGRRLAGYAYAYASPECDLLPNLVESARILDAKVPFNQYWGILAIRRAALACGSAKVEPSLISDLRALRKSVRPDTDRYYELSRLLELLEQRS